MQQAIRKSLMFWGIVLTALIGVPFVLVATNVGLTLYFLLLSYVLIGVFGPGVPAYIFYKIYSLVQKSNRIRPNQGLFALGIGLMALVALIWVWLLILMLWHPEPGGGDVFAFAIFPLLIVGAIGVKCAETAIQANEKKVAN